MYSTKIRYYSDKNDNGSSDSLRTLLLESEKVDFYRKTISSKDDYDKLLNHLGKFANHISKEIKNYPIELIVLTIYNGDHEETFVINCHDIFITNDKGSTVEVVQPTKKEATER